MRGIVIKLFYHTLALLFCFISQTLPSGWVKNMLFLPHFKFLSFNIRIYSEKIIVQYSLKKRVILISHIFRIGSTKSTCFSVLYFFPYTVSCAYNFSAVNHLLLTEVKVLFYVRSGAFVGWISWTFVSRTRVFSSFLYRLFNNRAYN